MQRLTEPLSVSKSSSLPVTPPAHSPQITEEDIYVTPSPTELNSIYGGVTSSVSAPHTAANSQDNWVHPTTQAATSNTANWSTSLQTVLDQPPSELPRQLILGGLAFCLAFGAWATFGQIDEVGHAQGRLVPKGDVYKINPIESGKIASIRVKEGQSVKAGQVLVELDTEIARQEVERLQQKLVTDQLQLAQKQVLVEKTRLEAGTRVEIAKAEAQAQQAAIAQAQDKAQAQKVTITQNQATAENKRLLIAQLQTEEAAELSRINRLKPLEKEGAVASEQIFQAEQSLRDRQRSIIQSQGELQQSLVEPDRLQAQLRQALAESAQLQAGLTQKQAEGRKAQLEALQQIQQLEVETTQLKAQIAETQSLLNSAKAKLKQRFLYAPTTGIVSSLNVHNTGEVVQPGQAIAELAPQHAPLILSASLPNQEAGFVKVGMPAQIKLDAYPFQDYGIVTGKVISISPDTKPDERQGAVYKVEIALARNNVTARNQTIQFKAGQTANAEIIIHRRRVAEILLDPIRQLQKGGINF